MTSRRRDGRGSSPSSLGKQRAAEVVQFFEGALRHTKGALAGRPFRLADWQRRDIIEPVFGTLQEDGRRTYSTVFIELSRKNGKSALCSGIALVMLFLEQQMGAEVLCLASDVDQGRVVFGEAKRMTEGSPEIQQAFHPVIYRDAIEYPETGSVLRVLSADEKGIHGRNPSALVLDELHTFTTRKQREFYTGATTAMGAQLNPLTLMISSAGWDKNSVCFELHQYAAEVRAGVRQDPSFLSVHYGAAEHADWTDRYVWRIANPALTGPDAFLSMDYLENEFRQAEAMPARQNAFRTFFLNEWVQQANRWIDLRLWDAAAGHPTTNADLEGRTAHGGLDLSATDDLTAWVLLLPCRETEGAWDVVARFFLPESALERHRNADLYQQFKRDGWLTVTPGDTIDYRIVEAAIVADAKRVTLRGLNIDARFQGIQVATSLIDQGLDVREMPQTFGAYAAPMREFERLLKAGRLHHGGHPILRWMADNVVVRLDGNGDMKPDKQRSHEKIDGICSIAMALDLAIRQPAREPEYQMYILNSRR